MYKTLEKFNFGNFFINMVKTLYSKPIFKVKNNGWMSKSCEMQRGIRQGCPVSALIFIFILEILAIQIRKNDDIQGLSPGNLKIVQHADDCTNLLKDINSLEKALNTICEFSKVAGTKLNMEKTECLLTGNLIDMYQNEEHIAGVRIAKNYVKSLGVYLGHDKNICYEMNWTSKLEKLEKILSVWRTRNLTIFGKCIIINTLAISKLIYNAFLLSNPKPDFFKKVSKLVFNFLWKKKERIKRNTLIGKVDQGGIGIPDVESKFYAAKASWIRRILDERSIIHKILNNILKHKNISVNDIVKTNVSNFEHTIFFKMIKLPFFYGEVISAFNKCKKVTQICNLKRNQFFKEFIWNNYLFKYDSKPLYFENWIKSGILYIKDMFDNDGNFYSIEHFYNILERKNNILCEYIMIKKALKV